MTHILSFSHSKFLYLFTGVICAFVLSMGPASAQLNCPSDPYTWNSSSVTNTTDALPFTQRNWVCSLSEMTKQISAMSLAHTTSIGTFFDAQNHIQTQRSLQNLQAIAHKNYMPSTQVCRLSSIGNNLARNESFSQRTRVVLNNFMLERDIGSLNSGDGTLSNQVRQFEKTYCNFNSNGTDGLRSMCNTAYRNDSTILPDPVNPGRFNRDINYTALLDMNNSLDINFDDSVLTDDETDVLAMSRLLYIHTPFYRPNNKKLRSPDAPYVIADLRSLLAKYGVAKNSYSKIIAMKAEGSATSTPFTENAVSMLVNPSVAAPFLEDYLGENPSYHAQMEILTKKIYQNPAFYTGLIESPSNVKRQKAAMAGIKLMQDRDFLEAMLRREMLLSQILEVKISEKQLNKEPSFYDPKSAE